MASTICNKPILYSFFVSSCAWRVRNALAYKGIDYEYRGVNLIENEQGDEEYKRLNPMGQVPALIVDGRTITQSMSILEFIEETFPEKPLLPKCHFERAKVREICELVVSGIQPMQNISVSRKQSGMSETEWSLYFNLRGLEALEKILEESSGQFCVKDTVSLADCCVVPQVFAATVRFNVEIKNFPVTARVYENLSQLESFKAAHPLVQPDYPHKE